MHKRHRRGSVRQSSGSETDGDALMGSGLLNERMRPTSADMGNKASKGAAVLEEAAEDV